MPPAPEGRRRPFGDDAASRGALQPRQIFKAHRDAAGSTRAQDLEAGGGAGSAPGDQLRDLRICKKYLSLFLVGHKTLEGQYHRVVFEQQCNMSFRCELERSVSDALAADVKLTKNVQSPGSRFLRLKCPDNPSPR